jgi:anti-sigma-K factor RskA
METAEENQITQFLLGQLSEEDRLKVEERIFEENGFYEQVLAIQEELSDCYVCNDLSATQRTQFENQFLRSPRRRERVEFASALKRALDRQQSAEVPAQSASTWWKSFLAFRVGPGPMLAALSAALVMLIGLSWLYLDNRRLANRVEQGNVENGRLADRLSDRADSENEKQRLESEIAALKQRGAAVEATLRQKEEELEAIKRASKTGSSSPSLVGVATFVLSSGMTRGTDEPEKLMISGTSRLVNLQLALEKPENYEGYVAEIRTARGNLVLSRRLPARQQASFGQAVSLTVPASQLPIGEYEVTLKGVARGSLESIGYYYFISLRR